MNLTRTLGTALLCFALSASGLQAQTEKKTAYLFTYFTGNAQQEEQIRFAVSRDGLHFYALNDNEPVISSDTIAVKKAVRDPHILRGEDGYFYMVATDMKSAEGWSSNRGLVLLRSRNLTDWEHHAIHFPDQWDGKFADVTRVWAPQTIYDREAGKYLVYFSILTSKPGDYDKVYYCYANEDFSSLSEPKILYDRGKSTIDGDIIYKDGVYHMFFKTEGEGNGIQQATSRGLHGKWKEDFKYLDAYAGTGTVVEGSSVFKLNGSDEYVLMYDLYSSGRYEYQTSRDLKTFTREPQSFRKDFFPRHGSVVSLTADELERVQERWGHVLGREFTSEGNPVVRHKHTCDPAAFVEGDTLWLYTGHDFAGNQGGYRLKDWCVFSTTDMKHWTEHPTPLRVSDFAWDRTGAAYAAHVVKKNGKYYYYISTNGSGIGVAVADRPEGPFRDAIGKPLLTTADCSGATHSWVCIDPAVFIDDDGQAYIFWGNRYCYYAKLKDNMVEIDGEIHRVDFPGFAFTEAPWVHKYKGKYYLTYATGWPEKIAYAMADHIGGPYEYKGILSEIAGNSNTTHPSIVEFKGKWYFFTHNGGLPDGTSYSRSVCAEPLEYNADGTIRRVHITTEGLDAAQEE